jgi:bifunctional DNA-binding transcriptional regulator/antitoxin component of YhaV-PrlF toxin-antitoxin module
MNKNRIASAITSAVIFAAMSSLGTMPATAKGLSELSAIGTVSVIGGSLLVVASPFILVGEIVTNASDKRSVDIRVTTDKGQTETIQIPKETCDKVGIKQGDKLKVTPNATGALISKGEKPVVYLVTPENAKLSRNHELAR